MKYEVLVKLNAYVTFNLDAENEEDALYFATDAFRYHIHCDDVDIKDYEISADQAISAKEFVVEE